MVMTHLRLLCARLQLVGSLLVLLGGCAMGAPRSGMGALFATPQAALADALGPGGWLGGGLEGLILHQQLQAPEGALVLYSGYAGGNLVLGSADAKPRGAQWYAHGMLRLPVPELSGMQRMSCGVMRYQSSGTGVVAVTGRAYRPDVSSIVVVFDSGAEERATMRDGTFMLLRTEPSPVRELRAKDAGGAVVVRVPGETCASFP